MLLLRDADRSGCNAHNRGKISEEDTTETPMYVNRGGRLTILQEDQGQ
ncbi:hypothetical protein ORP98_004476, partial [Escherichia coli]|nr:hypothetical protein [Escherichia coli]